VLNEYRIMDADGHVVEPPGFWKEYLEPAFKDRAPYEDETPAAMKLLSQAAKFGLKGLLPNPARGMKIENEVVYNKISDEFWSRGIWEVVKNYTEPAIKRFDATSQVKAMKQMGIDVSFVYPTLGLWVLAIDTMDPKLAGALTRAYNNWLRDFCSYDTQVLRGVGAVNLHAPEEMVPELHRIAEFGWKAVFVHPTPVKGRLLCDPAYEPFWSECERLGIAVGIHEATHSRLPTTGSDRFHTRFGMHACSHPLEGMMALLALLEGGVLERHPRLRVAFLEAGCGWLPYWLWRLDDLEYKNLAWEVRHNLKMKPSEYFRRQCFIACEPDEPYIHEIIKYVGEDNLLFASDYPHMDHEPEIVGELVELESRLPKRTIQKILWDNPVRFYGLSE
jgi:uncharacterized protein